MITFPKAKINIGLQILGKREDGYHEIQTVMYPIGWKDALEINPSKENKFKLHGISLSLDGPSTCENIHEKMQQRYGIPNVEIHLTKGIPSGAGLGGGSADAAYTVKMLNDLFSLNLSDIEMEELCAEVGSDCPFFIKSQPQICEGRGEILTPHPLSLSGLWIVAINPKIHISTGEAYSNANHSGSFDPNTISAENIDDWENLLKNDFQEFTFKKHPKIAAIKSRMDKSGARYSALSGSGSTVFGLFSEEPPKTWSSDHQIWIEKL
jgi:4-diphosphocytidyl-2-C-methyl-D-erythritol kinase